MDATHQDASPDQVGAGECLHLGSKFSPLAGDQLEDPYSFYARIRVAEPVFFSPLFQMWFVTRYDDVDAILADPETFSSRDVIPDFVELGPEVQAVLSEYRQPQNMINMDPPGHTMLRRLVQQAFNPRRVAGMEAAVREVAATTVDGFAADGHADLIAQLAYPLPLTVIFRLLGIPAEDAHACQRWTTDLKELNFGGSRLPPQRQVECAQGVVAYQRYVEDLVAVRAAAPGDDLISILIQAQDQDGTARLSLHQVADQIQALIIGGHETLANALGNTLRLLLAEPGRWRLVCQDPGLRESAIEEGLRSEPPATGMIRTTTRPVSLGDVSLPAGTRLFVLFASANHDETRFPEPEQYRLDRAAHPRHLAFGRGIHYCVGAPLARLEARIALEVLGQRLSGLRLAPGQSPEHVPNLMFRGLARLPVIWDV